MGDKSNLTSKDFKVGDMVYWSKAGSVVNYCKVQSIDERRIWGEWRPQLEKAKNVPLNTETGLSYMSVDEVFPVKVTDWKKIIEGEK